MAFLPYTGAQTGASITFSGDPIIGWERIVIREDGKPLPEPLDKTIAASSGYEYQSDTLGGKGNEKATVTVTGKLKRTDYKDGSGILAVVIDTLDVLIARKGTGAGKDGFTMTMYYKSLKDNHAHAGKFVDYEMTFEANETGVWAATLS